MIAAFFDVDRTLLPGVSMEQLFVLWLFRQRRLGLRDAARIVREVVPRLPEMRRRGLLEYHGYLTGLRAADVGAWAARCLAESIHPRLSPEGAACLRAHRAAGHLTVVLSGSIQPLVERLATDLGADLWVASVLESRDGRYTGRLEGKQVAAAQKAARVRELAARLDLDLTASYCYADHRSDVAMLECFGHPVPTNPGRALARLAAARGWEVRRFHPPGRRT